MRKALELGRGDCDVIEIEAGVLAVDMDEALREEGRQCDEH